MVFLPDGCFEPLATCIADSDVGKEVIVVVGDQGVCEELPKRMVWH